MKGELVVDQRAANGSSTDRLSYGGVSTSATTATNRPNQPPLNKCLAQSQEEPEEGSLGDQHLPVPLQVTATREPSSSLTIEHPSTQHLSASRELTSFQRLQSQERLLSGFADHLSLTRSQQASHYHLQEELVAIASRESGRAAHQLHHRTATEQGVQVSAVPVQQQWSVATHRQQSTNNYKVARGTAAKRQVSPQQLVTSGAGKELWKVPPLRRISDKEGPVAVTVMKDQDGCRLLQHLLRVASDDLKRHIVALALPDFHKMMTDPLGNYFCQSALQVASEAQLSKILDQCANLLPSMSKSLYGTRAVQKLIVKVCNVQGPAGKEMSDTLSKAFAGRICDLALDSYGSHVVRELLQSLPDSYLNEVHAEVRQRVFEIATAKRGYCAVQRCLQTNSPGLRQLMVQSLLPYTQRLLLDPFGNFIAQCILNLGDEVATAHVIEVVLLNLLEYTNHKFASNVVELCILRSNVYQLGSFIGGVVSIGIDGLISVLEDPFGNYVIQLLLEMTPTTGFSPLPKLIQMCLPRLSLSPQGRRIAHIFNNKYPQLCQLPESYSLWRDLRSSYYDQCHSCDPAACTSTEEDEETDDDRPEGEEEEEEEEDEDVESGDDEPVFRQDTVQPSENTSLSDSEPGVVAALAQLRIVNHQSVATTIYQDGTRTATASRGNSTATTNFHGAYIPNATGAGGNTDFSEGGGHNRGPSAQTNYDRYYPKQSAAAMTTTAGGESAQQQCGGQPRRNRSVNHQRNQRKKAGANRRRR